jgi:hypothetical protein
LRRTCPLSGAKQTWPSSSNNLPPEPVKIDGQPILRRRRPALAIDCASVKLERFVAWSAPVKIIA